VPNSLLPTFRNAVGIAYTAALADRPENQNSSLSLADMRTERYSAHRYSICRAPCPGATRYAMHLDFEPTKH
jgi:hypothetical protein